MPLITPVDYVILYKYTKNPEFQGIKKPGAFHAGSLLLSIMRLQKVFLRLELYLFLLAFFALSLLRYLLPFFPFLPYLEHVCYGRAHLRAGNLLGSRLVNVGRAKPPVKDRLHGLLDCRCRLLHVEGEPHHHGRREDRGYGVRHVLAGDIGGAPVNGLVHGAVPRWPEARRGEHPYGAGKHGRLVGEDVAEHVARDYDVELLRVPYEL